MNKFFVFALLCLIWTFQVSAYERSRRSTELHAIPVSQWTEIEKKSYSNYFAYCTGDFKGSPVNLRDQFPASQCQEGGTCGHVSSFGILGAALHRQDVENFSGRTLHTVKGQRPEVQLKSKNRIDAPEALLGVVVEGLPGRVDDYWKSVEDMGAAWGCEEYAKNNYTGSLFAGSGSDLIAYYLCVDGSCPMKATSVGSTAVIAEFKKRIIEACKEASKGGNKFEKKDFVLVLERLRKDFESQNSPEEIAKTKAADALKKKFDLHKLKVRNKPRPAQANSEGITECPQSGSDKKFQDELLGFV